MPKAFTIGYEGTDIETFVAALKKARVELVADVRAVAISRKKGFSKSALKSRLETEGIAYQHFASLGDPKPGRLAARAGKFSEFRQIYSLHLATAPAQSALRDLEDACRESAACLLCFEREPEHCHRTLIASRLRSSEFEIVNLFGNAPGHYGNFNAKISSRHSRESAAAA